MLIDSLIHIDNTADVKMKCDYVLVQNLSISALVALANIFVDNFTMLAAEEYGITIGNFLFFNLKKRLIQTLLFYQIRNHCQIAPFPLQTQP